jgi:hypothetical protein
MFLFRYVVQDFFRNSEFFKPSRHTNVDSHLKKSLSYLLIGQPIFYPSSNMNSKLSATVKRTKLPNIENRSSLSV